MMAKREKKPIHKVVMTEGKRQIIQQLLQEYDIETAEDIVYSGRIRHTARSFRTRLPEFEDTLSVIWTHPVPVKQVSASGTGCY